MQQMGAAAGREEVIRVFEELWDPIGVGTECGRGEYTAYVDDVLALMMSGANVEHLTRHLLEIERQRMGLTGNTQVASAVARRLRALADQWDSK
jgi:hypothetical protein